MLPASNRGPGQAIGFPDTCLTPAAPSPVPVPYPNIAMNAQASPFATSVKVNMMNALNLVSTIPMTMGDEAGSAHPMVKQAQRYTLGSFNVFIEGMPGIHLGSMTNHNNMNCPVGAVIVPSAPNVTYSFVPGPVSASALRATRTIGEGELAALGSEQAASSAEASLVDGVVTIGLARIARGAAQEVAAACLRDGQGAPVVLDLRGCPGGDLDEAAAIASLFVARGRLLFTVLEEDGDTREVSSRGGPLEGAEVTVLVDGGTASAAEVLAGALAAYGATLRGSTTFGKGVLHEITSDERGAPVLARTGHVVLPGGCALDGVGLTP